MLVAVAAFVATACASRPADPFPVAVGDGLFIMMVTPGGTMPNVRRLADQLSKANSYCSSLHQGIEIIVDQSEENGRMYDVSYFRCVPLGESEK